MRSKSKKSKRGQIIFLDKKLTGILITNHAKNIKNSFLNYEAEEID